MNLLDLKRSLWALPGLRGYGDGGAQGSGGQGEGEGGGNIGGEGYGGGGGVGSDGRLGSGLYGQNFNYGLGAISTASPAANPNYGYSLSSVSGINLGVQNTNLQSVKNNLEASPVLGFLAGVTGLDSLAKLAAYAADKLSPKDMGVFRTASGLSEADVADAKAAVASGTESSFQPAGNSVGGVGSDGSTSAGAMTGATTQSGQAAAKTDPMADLFSSFLPGGSAAPSDFKMPEYNADPSGLMAKYQRDYLPYNQKMMAEVDKYGSADYQAQQRGQAMAGVQQQSDAQMGQAQRNMARMGVNPNSGRWNAMSNQNAMATAIGKVMAGMNSDKMANDTYQKGLSAVNTMGMGMAQLGIDAGKTKTAFDLSSVDYGLKKESQDQSRLYQMGALANQRYGIDKNVSTNLDNNQAKADAARSDNKWTLGTALAGSLLNYGGKL